MNKRWFTTAVIALFAWVTVAGAVLAWRTSMTTDEGIHTASAYLALTRGEHRFDPEHPFLFKYLTALPLLIVHPHLPPDDQLLWDKAAPTFYDSWAEARQWTDEWFYRSGNNAQLMIFLARIPGVLALLGLCALVFYAASRWFSPKVGLWALFFTAFSPTLLGHGSLTNTDVPLALAFLGALWTLWLYGEKPSYKTALYAGLSIAATLLTKFSGVAILPVALIWMLYTVYRHQLSWRTVLLHVLLVLAVVWVSIWTIYLWRSPLDLSVDVNDPLKYAQSYLSDHGSRFSSIAGMLHHILPSAYLKGLIITLGGTEVGRETYLVNHLFGTGVWFYFPVLFLLKTQFVALLLGAFGIGLLWKSGVFKRRTPLVVLLLSAVIIFGGLALKSKLNLGIRHITPLLVLFSIFLAVTAARLTSLFKLRWLAVLGILCYALPVFWQFGNLIGYGNVLVTPADKAYLYYDDSNLDWGQQAQAVAETVKTRFYGTPLYVNYMWNPYALEYFSIETRSFDPTNPPRDVLILVTGTQLARDPQYASFRSLTPQYILQNNSFFYELASH